MAEHVDSHTDELERGKLTLGVSDVDGEPCALVSVDYEDEGTAVLFSLFFDAAEWAGIVVDALRVQRDLRQQRLEAENGEATDGR